MSKEKLRELVEGGNRNLYEVISDFPHKAYLDIDAKLEEGNPPPTREQFEAWILELIPDAELAWLKGHRTFRVIDKIESLITGKEILCPASKEAGYKTQCITCGLCAGTSTNSHKSIAIVAHGAGAGNFKRKAA